MIERVFRTITNIINEHPLITVEHKEVKDLAKFDLENEYVLIASGPLTSDNLYKSLKNFLGEDLYFLMQLHQLLNTKVLTMQNF